MKREVSRKGPVHLETDKCGRFAVLPMTEYLQKGGRAVDAIFQLFSCVFKALHKPISDISLGEN